MKFNFCPTCGEYLNICYDNSEMNRRCPLGHSLQVPQTVISATAILTDKSKLFLERKWLFNREFWALPHIEVNHVELPEHTLSQKLQTVLNRKVSVESLLFADGDQQIFHLFYQLKLISSKMDFDDKPNESYQWCSWKEIPWNLIAYPQHHDILLKWLAVHKGDDSDQLNHRFISQHRGFRIL